MVYANRHKESASGHKFRMGRTFKNCNIDNLHLSRTNAGGVEGEVLAYIVISAHLSL